MRVATSIGLAFVTAAADQFKKKGDKPEAWLARAVQEKVDHSAAGTKPVKDIELHVSKKTMNKCF